MQNTMTIETLLHMGFPNLPTNGEKNSAETENNAYICAQTTESDESTHKI
jgi:hypothetical protein